jgi:hypothetical protein
MKLSKSQLKKISLNWYITDTYFGCGYLVVKKKTNHNFPYDRPVLEKMGFEIREVTTTNIANIIPTTDSKSYREYTGELQIQSEKFEINSTFKQKVFLAFNDITINADFYNFCKSFFEKYPYKIFYKDSTSPVLFTSVYWDIVVMPMRK